MAADMLAGFLLIHRGWLEGPGKGRLKIIDLIEVFQAVGFRFTEDPVFDEVEDDLAEIRGGMDSPGFEKGAGHGAVLIESVLADTLAEFAAGDVALSATLLLAANCREGMIEGLPYEEVGADLVAGIVLADQTDDLMEVLGSHYIKGKCEVSLMQPAGGIFVQVLEKFELGNGLITGITASGPHPFAEDIVA